VVGENRCNLNDHYSIDHERTPCAADGCLNFARMGRLRFHTHASGKKRRRWQRKYCRPHAGVK
jgi:hypothetical protein